MSGPLSKVVAFEAPGRGERTKSTACANARRSNATAMLSTAYPHFVWKALTSRQSRNTETRRKRVTREGRKLLEKSASKRREFVPQERHRDALIFFVGS